MENRLKGKIIAVDFDGVISKYDTFKGIGVFGKPVEGVQWALRMFREMGAIVTVYSCRRESSLIQEYMDEHKIPWDFINHSPLNHKLKLNPKKLGADIYIDDRAVQFRGEWQKTYQEVVNFRRWGKDLGSAISSKNI